MHDVLGTLDLPDTHRGILRDAVSSLESRLADILDGLVLYGSAVRGGFVPAFSDLNLLIVLEVSTPEAHTVISDVVAGARVEIDPFVLAREGLERSFRAFAVKFDSIHRHYRVLSGTGVHPLAEKAEPLSCLVSPSGAGVHDADERGCPSARSGRTG